MARTHKRGTQIFNKFILKEKFPNNTEFEKEVQKTFNRIKDAWWLYKDFKIGIVSLLRNKHGARIIAYNLPNKN